MDTEQAAGRLGFEVELARMKRGMTQLDLANRSGLSLTTIQSIESGRAGVPRRRTVAGLEKAFDWSEGSVARILQGGQAKSAHKGPATWASMEDFCREVADSDEAAARLIEAASRRLAELGKEPSHVVGLLSWSDGSSAHVPRSTQIDSVLEWPTGMAAAIMRGAAPVDQPSMDLPEFRRDDEYPYQSVKPGRLTAADELRISGSGLPLRDQEFIARAVARIRSLADVAATVEIDALITELRSDQ